MSAKKKKIVTCVCNSAFVAIMFPKKYFNSPLSLAANFHLRNGAMIWRLNWLADQSPRGMGASCGLMVNYRYYLDSTEDNSKNYIERHEISASEDFLQIVNHIPEVGETR